ncbi:MAG: MFS transporter [Actinomycetes bacterium]
MNASSGPAPRERWIVICLALAGFIATLDDYIVAVSLPTIAETFDASTSQAAMVTMAYLGTLVSALLLFGWLGDRVGHRRVFLAGYVVFIVGSGLCAASPGIGWLIGFRIVQGAGAAMLSVTGPAIIAERVTGGRRGRAFALFTTVTALGITLGAPLGGIITGLLSWHVIFLINIPIGLAALAVAYRVLPADGPRTRQQPPFDVAGAVLSTAGLILLLIGLNQGEELGGWLSPPVVTIFTSAALLLAGFAWWERRARHPLINRAALGNRAFVFSLLAALTGYMLLAGCNFVLPFYLIYIVGLRPEQVGLVMLAYSAVYVAASPVMGHWADQVGARRVSALGMILGAGACIALMLVVGWTALLIPVAYLIWRALSYSMFIAPNNALVLESADAQTQGGASGLLKVSVNLSLVLGVVVFETLLSLPILEGLGSLKSMSATGSVSRETILFGMRIAYGFGALACVAAALFTLAAVQRRKLAALGNNSPHG